MEDVKDSPSEHSFELIDSKKSFCTRCRYTVKALVVRSFTKRIKNGEECWEANYTISCPKCNGRSGVGKSINEAWELW